MCNTRKPTELWFPEPILSNSFLETYVLHAENVRGHGRMFLSHMNYSAESVDFIIRIENNSDEPIEYNMIEDCSVQTTETYPDKVVRDHLVKFYDKLSAGAYLSEVIAPGKALDIPIQNIEDHKFFTGQLELDISNEAAVTVTMFLVPSSTRSPQGLYHHIPTPVQPYDYTYTPVTYTPNPAGMQFSFLNYTTYSGVGQGYKISAAGMLNASQMMTPGGNSNQSIAFETGGTDKNINQRNGLHEIVDIRLSDPRGEHNEITDATWILNIPYAGDSGSDKRNRTRNYGNLGNWGMEYSINTTLINDTDTAKRFTCRLISPYQATMAIVENGHAQAINQNNKKYHEDFQHITDEQADQVTFHSDIKTWRIIDIVVPPNETAQVTYTYVLGTDSNANVFHTWNCSEVY